MLSSRPAGKDSLQNLGFYQDPMMVPFDDFWGPFTRIPDFSYPSLSLRQATSGIHVTEDEKEFKLAIDLPGVKADDIKVELKDEGRVLQLSGGRKVQTDTSFFETTFSKAFTLGSNIDSSKVTAHMAHGVLTVSAPKKGEVVQAIKITCGESPANEDTIDVEKK